MEKKKRVMTILVAAILLIGAGICGYYWYQGSVYVSTEDARLAAGTVSVTPQITGRITDWTAEVGSDVCSGDNLGWQDTGLIAASSGVDPVDLKQVGSMNISKAEIKAPISGRIIRSSVQEGQLAGPGQTLAVIADTGDMYVTANIEETEIKEVKVGNVADVSIDALGGQIFQGRVAEIGCATLSTFAVVAAQSSSGTFTKVTQLVPVKIYLPGLDQLSVIPGMSVEVKIHVRTETEPKRSERR